MKVEMKQYRQGDVFLVEIKKIPDGTKKIPRDNGRVVLAYGEATGHAHAIFDEKASLYADGLRPRRSYLRLPRKSTLRHEEHSPIELPAGKYLVMRQREYSTDEIRTVAD